MQNLHNRNISLPQGSQAKRTNFPSSNRFNKSQLPRPSEFYEKNLQKIKWGRKWAQSLCPFHPDNHRSFSFNLEKGSFVCFACGAKGSGIIDFFMKLHSSDFKTALRMLGRGASHE